MVHCVDLNGGIIAHGIPLSNVADRTRGISSRQALIGELSALEHETRWESGQFLLMVRFRRYLYQSGRCDFCPSQLAMDAEAREG